MVVLESPDDPDDLWSAVGSDVPPHRLLMQGDVLLIGEEPLVIITHACSMRRGRELHRKQMVAPIRDHHVPDWQGHYDWMPLPGAPVPSVERPAALLREIRTVQTDFLEGGTRVAVMSDLGIQLLQQRLVHHLARVVVETAALAEHCAPILAEVELHEEWVEVLGSGVEDDFHELLDADDRKLRSWLEDPARRAQARTNVRNEIRRRRP